MILASLDVLIGTEITATISTESTIKTFILFYKYHKTDAKFGIDELLYNHPKFVSCQFFKKFA
jgi:hypothetical protein